MSLRPLIGRETTPFFNLAPVSAASSPPTPPPHILYPPDSPIPCLVCKVVDNYETTQCIYCREELPIWHLSCIACVDAYDTTVAHSKSNLKYFCVVIVYYFRGLILNHNKTIENIQLKN